MQNTQPTLFSIGEVARSIGITRKIILNYETKGLIRPDQKEGATGNRYYTIDTFTQIRTIRVFQNLGLTLDEIRAYFDDTTELEPLIARLERLRDELNLSIEKLRERTNIAHPPVQIVPFAEQTLYCRTFPAASLAEKTDRLRQTALEAMKAYGTDTTRRMYAIEYALADEGTVTYCIAVPPNSTGPYVQKRAATRAVTLYHHGSYETLPDSRRRLLDFAAANRLVLTGRCCHLYIEGPPQHKDKSKFITQVILPLAD